MNNYLAGYLDILPQEQSNKIQSVINATMSSIDAGTISEAEFNEVIRMIAEDHQQLTEYIPQIEKLDEARHNAFFSKVATDMNIMFSESNLIERALGSYERLYDGILSDLSKEIKALREKIYSLRLVAEGENGLIIRTVDFSDNSSMETDRAKYSHLFKDRDGSDISDVTIERVGEVSYLSLNELSGKDRLRDETGKAVAKLEVIDHRGIPISQAIHPISKAIDDSSDSYWAEVVLTDEPINTAMEDVEGGGALVKFTITLPRPELISEIILTPFTFLPLEIASIKYEEDTETYHAPKELIHKKIESVQTMVVQFPSILAKRLTFVLRQKNYQNNTYLIRESEIGKADLWNKISKREMEETLNVAPSGNNLLAQSSQAVNRTVSQEEIDTYTGWDIYLEELAKFEEDYARYLAEVEEYNKKYQKYSADLAEYRRKYG